jgi:DNA anti-recombination protein RmuC
VKVTKLSSIQVIATFESLEEPIKEIDEGFRERVEEKLN